MSMRLTAQEEIELPKDRKVTVPSATSPKKHTVRVVALSTWGSEHLPLFLKELAARHIIPVAILLDTKSRERDIVIQRERTKGFFTWPDFSSVGMYRIPLYVVENHNSILSQELLRELQPDLLINAGTPRILKREIITIPTRGVLNIHPGALPAYRGCTAPEWALYNDDPIEITCHFMSVGIDDGPVVVSKVMPVNRNETYEEVRTRVLYVSAEVLASGVEKVATQNIFAATLPPPKEGTYWNVIPDEKLEEVKKKLLSNAYRAYTN